MSLGKIHSSPSTVGVPTKSPTPTTIVIGLLIIMLTLLKAAQSFENFKKSSDALEKIYTENAISQEAAQLSTKLLTTVQIASYSGNSSWENLYYDSLDQLNEILTKATLGNTSQIRGALDRLVKIDENIFEKIRLNDLITAKKIAFSIEHEKTTHDFSLEIADLEKTINESSVELIRQRQSAMYLNLCFSLVVAILTALGMLANIYIIRKWYHHMFNANQNLDRLIEARTHELYDQRQRSLNASRLASLGEMAAGVAHEINNPLAIISGHASKIERNLNEPSIPLDKLQSSAKSIREMTLRISKIIKGMQTFGRDGSRDPLEEYSIVSLLNDAKAVCTERMKAHGVDLRIPVLSDELKVNCRPSELAQVLINLINNAHDAVELLPEKWIEVSVKELNALVELTVTDSGTGISKAIQDKIMQPFFTTKGVGKGTGLGLSISKGIIEAHGGEFFLDNHSSHTRFVIRLKKFSSQVGKVAA